MVTYVNFVETGTSGVVSTVHVMLIGAVVKAIRK